MAAISYYSTIIGKEVEILIDRPLGSFHPDFPTLYYPINYGYIQNLFAGDGEEQDVYLLGVDEPIITFKAVVIAVIHRTNDVEDKWVAAPTGVTYSEEEIRAATFFQEKYYDYELFC